MPDPEASKSERPSWRTACPECQGQGFIWVGQPGGSVAFRERCPFCRGTGVVDVD